MDKYIITKIILFGFFTWLIPFAISFLFYIKTDEIIITGDLFKLMMIVIVSTTTCYFLFAYFKLTENNFIKTGVNIGLSWFLINILLDAITLIPMMDITFTSYFMSIGLRYAIIPIISITMGFLLNLKSKVITDL